MLPPMKKASKSSQSQEVAELHAVLGDQSDREAEVADAVEHVVAAGDGGEGVADDVGSDREPAPGRERLQRGEPGEELLISGVGVAEDAVVRAPPPAFLQLVALGGGDDRAEATRADVRADRWRAGRGEVERDAASGHDDSAGRWQWWVHHGWRQPAQRSDLHGSLTLVSS
ncbi:hypothetical protein [Nonomuraea dietziae]|uniref:hypothetical protein n=1 Tax=Nonomuraea dietziae TaxID=65515 RepID=UPI0033F904E0